MKMPNWCDNNLTLRHDDPEMIRRAVDAWESGNFLATLVPEPDYKTTPVAKSFPEISAQFAKTEEDKAKALLNEPTIREDAWWDWRIQNWGTKWDIGYDADRSNHAQVDDDGKGMFVYFDSAWSPPTEAYAKLADMGFYVKAYYYEGGNAFCGSWCSESGEDFYNIEECTYEWVRENIPRHIDDAMDISAQMAMDEECE
jgi:hypothetical protein